MVDKRIIRQFLPDSPIVFECGAHSGSDTEEMATQWVDSFIYAFEPAPHVYEYLVRRVGHLPNVTTVPLAIWDRVGEHTMYISSGASSASSSLRKPKDHLENESVLFNHVAKVPVTTFDKFMESRGIDRVDFLWLDMQGTEPESLMASPFLMSKVTAIYTEVALKEVYENNVLYSNFRKWLEQLGFSVVLEIMPYSDQGDVLFVRQQASRP